MRPISHVFALAALALLLSGCGGAARTSGQPTTLDSSELTNAATATPSALAATEFPLAKQAYLDYVAALNQLDLSDASSLEAVLALAAEPQLSGDRTFYGELMDKRWSIEGDVRVTELEVEDAEAAGTDIRLLVCADISSIRFLDDTGTERIPPDDGDVASTTVTMVRENGAWRVSHVGPRTGKPSCSS